jgi:metalloendopeptidase OMA1, mitochondrial
MHGPSTSAALVVGIGVGLAECVNHPDQVTPSHATRRETRSMRRAGNRTLGLIVGRPLIAVAIAAVVVGIVLLSTTHSQKTPVTHREQHVELTIAQQMQLGNREYAKTLRTNRSRIVSSGPQYIRVQRVAKRIEAVARRDKPAFVWRVTLIRKNVANAYCLPGGKIVVYTGILPVTQNDAGLATVLGHEVAHATAEHVAERLEEQHLTKVAVAIIAGGFAYTPGQYVGVMALLGVGSGLTFSRAQESEADHIGLIYMARAGYDPRQAVAFWKRMERASKGHQPPEFLSDHPSDAHRVQRVEGWLPEAERAYRPAQST